MMRLLLEVVVVVATDEDKDEVESTIVVNR